MDKEKERSIGNFELNCACVKKSCCLHLALTFPRTEKVNSFPCFVCVGIASKNPQTHPLIVKR